MKLKPKDLIPDLPLLLLLVPALILLMLIHWKIVDWATQLTIFIVKSLFAL